MSQTTYYEFNKPIGSDLVNPLVDEFPNWDIADAALHELDERSVANATEVVSLGVHAISRLNTYTKFIKWIATANYTAGETFTVDGNVVAAATPTGASLVTGAYVTGSVVLACLNADDSAMTIFVSGDSHASDSDRLGGELPNYYATASDMSNAQTDIGNIQALDGTTSIASIGDGTVTGAISTINTALGNKANKTYVEANNIGTAVTISTTPYTTTSDGYVSLQSVGSGAVNIKAPNGNSIDYVNRDGGGSQIDLVFVRKGFTLSSTVGTCKFYPLS